MVARAKRVDEKRARNETTIPGTMGEELATNPFLRADIREMQRAMGTKGDVETFAAIRSAKDNF